MNKEIDVFVSYSRKDYLDSNRNTIEGNVITKLKLLFLKNNITYWMDEEGIYSGDAFAQLIARNIKRCKIFLYISSENSNVSSWTSNEIAVATEYKKKIIPFRIDSSSYHDDAILYIAKLDYICYYQNQEKALVQVINSINEYKLLCEQQRKRQEKEQEEKERLARELEERNRQIEEEEQLRKEKERLESIAIEKKRKEEELNIIDDQIFELDKKEGELESKRDELEKEIKNKNRELSLVKKRRDQLEARRRKIEMQLGRGIGQDSHKQESITLGNSFLKRSLNPSQSGPNADNTAISRYAFSILKKFKSIPPKSSFKNIIIIILVFISLFIIGVAFKNCSMDDSKPVAKTPAIKVPVKATPIIVVKDTIFGIETADKLHDWNDLRIKIEGDIDTLHKVKFALIKATNGRDDFLKEECEYNRNNASRNNIRVALYHVLNPLYARATGKMQADNFITHVGKLRENELPPVLTIQPFKKEVQDSAYKRSKDWLRIIEKRYGVKPIVYMPKVVYNEYYKNWNLDNPVWIVSDNEIEGSFDFRMMFSRKVQYYNGKSPFENIPQNARLSIFCGTQKEFNKYGKKDEI